MTIDDKILNEVISAGATRTSIRIIYIIVIAVIIYLYLLLLKPASHRLYAKRVCTNYEDKFREICNLYKVIPPYTMHILVEIEYNRFELFLT